MAEFDMVIRGGTVVTAADRIDCDVGIRDGVIACLGRDLGPAERYIDASGKLVLPGGVDSHCHMEQHSPQGLDNADDFLAGTEAAAAGGNTTIMPFAMQFRGQSLKTAVLDYRALAEQKAVIDYAMHMIVSEPGRDEFANDLRWLADAGFTSLKVFTLFDQTRLDDRQILDLLALSRKMGVLVMFHAENHDAVAWQSERLLAAGKTAPKYHEMSRPEGVEREAVHRVLTFAELVDVPVMIVHVSGTQVMARIVDARRRGQRVYAETCPQYLLLASEDLDRPGLEGGKFMSSPPPRPRARQDDMWQALSDGAFDVFSSDHSPYLFEGPSGKLRHGPDSTFKQIANGMPGIEVRLPLLFSFGVGGGRIDLHEFVALASTNAAKIYGLYPRKGTIAVGSDADVAIWDPDREVVITQDLMHGNVDYTPFEGVEVRGWPVVTISRGEVICENGALTAERGRGEFIPCDLPLRSRN